MRFGRKQRRPDRPLIFVCSPYRGDTETNVQNARRYCRLVVEQGGIPFAPHLLFTQFLDEDKVAERRRGLWMGMEMLRLSGWASRYAGWTWREVWRMNDKCFALRARGVCGALSGDCSGYADCAFYKAKRQQEADQRRANARLRRLPQETQRIIADKYFSGEMPWRGEME